APPARKKAIVGKSRVAATRLQRGEATAGASRSKCGYGHPGAFDFGTLRAFCPYARGMTAGAGGSPGRAYPPPRWLEGVGS
ncbi:MAG TPA: hypothetical protein VK775_03990, partial [Chthoniobacterales bacterium]|nr:hypothetical protein [Chthoniobacterales bacterium]